MDAQIYLYSCKIEGLTYEEEPETSICAELVLVGSQGIAQPLPLTIYNHEWNQWIISPLKYKDLSFDAQWLINIYCISAGNNRRFIGGATLPLFNEHQ
jgi:hypothetical protein